MKDWHPDLAHESLKERVVLITGGGRGLGREMALSLVRAGARVMITAAASTGQLREVQDEAAAMAGQNRLEGLQADISVWEDCQRTVQATLETFGDLHVLVNNAGRGLMLISPTFNTEPVPFWQADRDAWRQIIDTNLTGTFYMTKAAAPHMVERGFGKIVNVSTSLQTMVRRGYSSYGPSKAALEACSRIWAQDLEGTGVTVNVLLPGGATDTAFIPPGVGRKGADGNLFPPHIMNAAMLWLASDFSNDETGQRYIGKDWDPTLPPAEAALRARQSIQATPAIM